MGPPVVGLADGPALVPLGGHGVDDDVVAELEGGLPDPGVDGGELLLLLSLPHHRRLRDEPASASPHLTCGCEQYRHVNRHMSNFYIST